MLLLIIISFRSCFYLETQCTLFLTRRDGNQTVFLQILKIITFVILLIVCYCNNTKNVRNLSEPAKSICQITTALNQGYSPFDVHLELAMELNRTNGTNNFTLKKETIYGPKDEVNSDDATWILTSAFIIFTMQSGFGLLESGLVSRKNEVNIMVKNAVDVIFGGLAYWMFGFAFSFGDDSRTNAFSGMGMFFTEADDNVNMGYIYSRYFFQLSFATTATTIVSGAMAERTDLKAYTAFSFFNTLTYCFPAHWVWAENGWLKKLGKSYS